MTKRTFWDLKPTFYSISYCTSVYVFGCFWWIHIWSMVLSANKDESEFVEADTYQRPGSTGAAWFLDVPSFLKPFCRHCILLVFQVLTNWDQTDQSQVFVHKKAWRKNHSSLTDWICRGVGTEHEVTLVTLIKERQFGSSQVKQPCSQIHAFKSWSREKRSLPLERSHSRISK